MQTIITPNAHIELLRESQIADIYTHHGDYIFETGPKDSAWSISVKNVSNGRIEVVLVVDGRDAITGESIKYQPLTQGGLVIPCNQLWEFRGFRRGNDNLARFRFSDYSGKTSYNVQMGGKVEDNGIIRLGIYTEKEPLTPYSRRAVPLSSIDPFHVGTAFGETEKSHVGTTTFQRSTSTPLDELTIHYYPINVLHTMGIIVHPEPLGGCIPPPGYRE